MSDFINAAKYFAIGAHEAISQLRKYTGQPYWTHCESVANMVSKVEGVTEGMIAAAWLHDTVEDTKIEIGAIGLHFGDEVERIVWGLTDTEQGNRATRKELANKRLSMEKADVQTIKLADLIDNTSTIVKYDKSFAKVYMAEKRELLKVLTKGDKGLWAIANEIVENYYRGLE